MSLSNAFPSVTPSLNLNFIRNNRLDPRLTYSRSTTATYVGSDGYIKTAAINAPRFEYDSVSLAPRGLLLEGPRTNLLTYSEQFDNATGWSVTTGAPTTLANSIISPDGNITADKIVEDTTTGIHARSRPYTFTSGITYTYSVYVKAGERTLVRIEGGNTGTWSARTVFDLSSGIIVSTTSGTATIQSMGNGWHRCTITGLAGATASTNINHLIVDSGVNTSYTGDGASGIYVWGAQLEEAFFASSYIQTTSATVTRAADAMAFTGSNFIPWYNQAGGAFVISSDTFKADNTANTTYSRIFNLSDGSTDSRYTLYYNTVGGVSMGASGAGFNASDSDSGVASKTVQKVGVNIQAGNSFLTHNGVQAGSTDTAAIVLNYMNRLTFFEYGTSSDEVNYGWGHIQYLLYYPEPLTLAQLQALTKQ